MEVAHLTCDEYMSYEASLKSYWDMRSSLSTKFEQGIDVSENNKVLEIAKSLKLANMPLESIISYTGLSSEEIANV